MVAVQIRPAVATDIPALLNIDHTCTTECVWQMDLQHEEDQLNVCFREVRLPRSVVVTYPRAVSALSEGWKDRGEMLVAVSDATLAGYLKMSEKIVPGVAWVTDLAVSISFRCQGIATALIMAVQSWAVERRCERVVLEMSSKNFASICLAQKLGYEFCGYNDRYYTNQDVALYFCRLL